MKCFFFSSSIFQLNIKLEFKILWKVNQALSLCQRSERARRVCCSGTVTILNFFLRQRFLMWISHLCVRGRDTCLFCVHGSQLRWCRRSHLSLLPLLDSLLKEIPGFQYLFPSDLRLPQRAEHHVGVPYLLAVGPLALQPAQGVLCGHAVSLCYP